jgi:hypothetical protein
MGINRKALTITRMMTAILTAIVVVSITVSPSVHAQRSKREKTTTQSPSGDTTYIEISNPVVLTQEAFAKDYKGKRVAFNARFGSLSDSQLVKGYSAKKYVQALIFVGDTNYIRIVVPKEKAEPLLGNVMNAPIKVYGKAQKTKSLGRFIPGGFGAGEAGIVIEVDKIELTNGSAANPQIKRQMQIGFLGIKSSVENLVKSGNFNESTRQQYILTMEGLQPQDAEQKKEFDDYIQTLKTMEISK